MPKKNFFPTVFDEKLILRNRFENIEFFLYSAFVFLIPILLGHTKTIPLQLIAGTLVNTFLVLGALYLGKNKLLPIILLPSIAVLLTGFIFGPLSFYLLYLIPFIWVANTLYIYIIKFLKLSQKRNYFLSIFAASSVKATFLFSATFLLFTFTIVPAPFLTAMGILQFTTAILGGTLASVIYFLRR